MIQILFADGGWSNQYTDTGWFAILVTILVCGFILLNIYRSNLKTSRGGSLYVRRIQGLNAIDEAVGRATEMGRPILMIPGIGALGPVVVQALNIFSYITKIAGKFATPILLCCADAPSYTVAQETIRDVYQSEGIGDKFDQNSVQFISDRQFAFAAGVSGVILRDQVAAAFFMGDFYAESLIFAETANSVGAIQIASSTQTTQTPFFIASCDYVLIGDEFYAASAYLTRQPVLTGSLVGQDWSKILVAFLVLFGALYSSYQLGIFNQKMTTTEKQNSTWQTLPAARKVKDSDTFMSHLFNPQDDPSLANSIHREMGESKPEDAGQ